MLNVQELDRRGPELLSRMAADGYSATYVARVGREVRRMVALAAEQGWRSYEDVYLGQVDSGRTAESLREERSVLRLIEQFVDHGRPPDGTRKSGLFPRGAYHRLVPEFRGIVDFYAEAARRQGKKDATIKVESSNASTFFSALQARGMATLGQVTEDAVLEIFSPPGGGAGRGGSWQKNVAAVLKAAAPAFPGLAEVSAFLPRSRQTRKNVQFLTAEEVRRVKNALRGAALSPRDKAIGWLAVQTGLRCCDIAGMTLDAIDWDADLIVLDQAKTGAPLVLPLTAVVGNAVWDHLASGRPDTGGPFLFVSRNRPHGPLRPASLHNIANKIMDAAGIRREAGDRRGLHLFRRHLATAMLGNDVPQPVISQTLGHTSPDSLGAYLGADLSHLRECSLSVDRFPVAEGVFSRG
ncbi:MAG: tyrosine-type recombinase/integrase [Bifidobacteriaceae bacterium]|jgi:integrase|nr:tyrosine-type recombinase/integrase [Bifidobacteriaceae bacterium]